jgi:hypothetical protein
VLSPENPGVPIPVKIDHRLAGAFDLDAQLDEATGRRLAEWAQGSEGAAPSTPTDPDPELADATEADVDAVLELARSVGDTELQTASNALDAHRDRHGRVDPEWLGKLRDALKSLQTVDAVPELDHEPVEPETLFRAPTGERGA